MNTLTLFKILRLRNRVSLLALCPLLAACGSDEDSGGAQGSVQIIVEPEDSIPDGLEPGSEDESISDGWRVSYDRFLISIGNFRARRSDDSGTLTDPTNYVLDLKAAPAGGYIVKEFRDVAAARWDRFGFDLPNATSQATILPPTQPADLELMAQGSFSVYFEGAIEKADGQSCPPGSQDPSACMPAPKVSFRWGLSAGTSFDDCATEDGLNGFAVPSGGSAQVKPTVHGDHWFFNSVTSGTEITQRLAQYIADSDLNHDGETTIEELKQVDAAAVFPSPQYNLSGALGGPIETAYDYVLAQARTLGDFQGDGECPSRKILP